ncbi:MAG TPA: metal-sensing transcriptional repressor [Candidatus Coprousia avicola]|nr:metal-sensing transcriptional repressor [Candidatus Coprousia avicola]
MQADTEKTLRLLRTARGQIDGIIRMVESDRYCIDISTQLMATQSMLARINADVLKAHLEHCVAGAMESGTAEEKARKLDEIERVIDKLAK